jgi:aminoglycoside phosphotransferase (APT) family kinase protein
MELDPDELGRRVTLAAQAWAPGVSIGDVKPLPGGASSLTYLAGVRDGPVDRLVLKAAFPGAPAIKNRDVLRQARLLKALAGAEGVAVPQVFFEDLGVPPDVPPVFGMSFEVGESFEPNMDEEDPGSVLADVDARARAAARMLAALHGVSLDDVGLGDEPAVTVEDEIERWVATFATVTDELRPGADACAERLRAGLPGPLPTTLIHGDWRLGNLLCEGTEIRAGIDWEIWARSDPRIDLAWFLHPTAVRHHPGMPAAPELLAEYEAASGTKPAAMPWFTALMLFKMGAVTALIVKHKRRVADPAADTLVARIPVMIERANALAGG